MGWGRAGPGSPDLEDSDFPSRDSVGSPGLWKQGAKLSMTFPNYPISSFSCALLNEEP